jgi:hypothetical protein
MFGIWKPDRFYTLGSSDFSQTSELFLIGSNGVNGITSKPMFWNQMDSNIILSSNHLCHGYAGSWHVTLADSCLELSSLIFICRTVGLT